MRTPLLRSPLPRVLRRQCPRCLFAPPLGRRSAWQSWPASILTRLRSCPGRNTCLRSGRPGPSKGSSRRKLPFRKQASKNGCWSRPSRPTCRASVTWSGRWTRLPSRHDRSDARRPILLARVPLKDADDDRHEITLRVTYRTELMSRDLKPLDPEAKEIVVEPLKKGERAAALATADCIDFNSPDFQAWLDRERCGRAGTKRKWRLPPARSAGCAIRASTSTPPPWTVPRHTSARAERRTAAGCRRCSSRSCAPTASPPAGWSGDGPPAPSRAQGRGH